MSESPCGCAYDWRVEALNLATGKRQRFLTPLSINFEQVLNEVGSGDITLPVRSVMMGDIWPDLTSIMFSRISGPGASSSEPFGEFIGIVKSASPSSSGVVKIGLKSIEEYLGHRIIVGGHTWVITEQTRLGSDLVDLAEVKGVPLHGGYTESSIIRDRTYLPSDQKVILEAISQLTQVIDGPDYELIHTLENGSWSTEMRFHDYLGNTTPSVIDAQRGVISYDIDVDSQDHANRIIGVGEDPSMTYIADASDDSIYPLFDRSVSWSDVSDPDTLEQHSEGELANSLHPTAVPSITIADLEIASSVNLGDSIRLRMNHGAIQYNGLARVVGKAWTSSEDTPTMCTFSLVPLDDVQTAILNVNPTDPICC